MKENTVMIEGTMLIITPDDEILMQPYTGYEDSRKAVQGYIETLPVVPFFADIFTRAEEPEMRTVKCHYICNEEGCYAPTGYDEKVNAMASLMYGQPIFGAVAVLKLAEIPVIEDGEVSYTDIDDAGFTENEANYLKTALEKAFEPIREKLKEIHKELDDAKKAAYEME